MQTENKMIGYPAIDKPWLKYYTEETINTKLLELSSVYNAEDMFFHKMCKNLHKIKRNR